MSSPKPKVAILQSDDYGDDKELKHEDNMLIEQIKYLTDVTHFRFNTIKKLLEITKELQSNYFNYFDNIIILSHGNQYCIITLQIK